MPRPVSDAIADGLPLWDTYEALFFLVTGVFLGLILGFLFPSAWRSFRRRFRRLDRYRSEYALGSRQLKFSAKSVLLPLEGEATVEDENADVDLVALFVAARYAVQESAFRDAVQIYLQILGSEKVSRVQTNKAMFELAQVYGLSGLSERAVETALELLHRKPAQTDVFRFLLSQLHVQPHLKQLSDVLETYSGPKSFELSREVAHVLSESAFSLLDRENLQDAVALAKWAVRWSPGALEPKLALVQSTSVLNSASKGLPLDQSVLGFFVDLAELRNLHRQHNQRAPFDNLSLFKKWTEFFDRRDEEVCKTLTRLRSECLAQLGWENHLNEATFRSEIEFLMKALLGSRARPRPDNVRWDSVLLGLLSIESGARELDDVYVCQSCSALRRDFRWCCPGCQRWETLQPWTPAQPLVQR